MNAIKYTLQTFGIQRASVKRFIRSVGGEVEDGDSIKVIFTTNRKSVVQSVNNAFGTRLSTEAEGLHSDWARADVWNKYNS